MKLYLKKTRETLTSVKFCIYVIFQYKFSSGCPTEQASAVYKGGGIHIYLNKCSLSHLCKRVLRGTLNRTKFRRALTLNSCELRKNQRLLACLLQSGVKNKILRSVGGKWNVNRWHAIFEKRPTVVLEEENVWTSCQISTHASCWECVGAREQSQICAVGDLRVFVSYIC